MTTTRSLLARIRSQYPLSYGHCEIPVAILSSSYFLQSRRWEFFRCFTYWVCCCVWFFLIFFVRSIRISVWVVCGCGDFNSNADNGTDRNSFLFLFEGYKVYLKTILFRWFYYQWWATRTKYLVFIFGLSNWMPCLTYRWGVLFLYFWKANYVFSDKNSVPRDWLLVKHYCFEITFTPVVLR